jgi:hypothetical protein
VEAKTLIDQLDDLAGIGRLALPLKFRQTFGTPIQTSLDYPLTCWYQTAFELAEVSGDCRLRMDAEAIQGGFSIYLNGKELDATGFQPLREYDSANRSCQVGPLLVKGLNRLVVRVEAQHDWDGLTDPLYLVGNFGVFSNPAGQPLLAAAPQTAHLNGKIQPGFPYYAGTLAFKKTIQNTIQFETGMAGLALKLRFEDLDPELHDCVEVLLNGVSLGVRAWSPYAWTIDPALAEPGSNALEVRVSNSLAPLLEGKYFDYPSHSLLPVTES